MNDREISPDKTPAETAFLGDSPYRKSTRLGANVEVIGTNFATSGDIEGMLSVGDNASETDRTSHINSLR